MAFLVLAYPNLQTADLDLIQTFRKANDQLYYSVVEPHFTIVFPVFDQTKGKFSKAIHDNITGLKKLNFTIRCATINKDAFTDYYHTFLVPDEGYSRIIKLHDRLYERELKGNLRLDIDFVPHIGVGNSKDKFECKKMADHWNKTEFSITGAINNLTIVEYDNEKVTKLEEIELI